MKKILSLLTAITLTASGASSVVSCNTKQKQKQNTIITNKVEANTIAKFIDGKTINILENINNKTIDKYKSSIDLALTEIIGAPFTTNELKDVTYNGRTPEAITDNNLTQEVTATVKYNKIEADIQPTFTINFVRTAQEVADKIAQNPYVIVMRLLKANATAQDYQNDIQKELNRIVSQSKDVSYSFIFATDSDKNIPIPNTKTKLQLWIKIKVANQTSKAFEINVSFPETTNYIAHQLDNQEFVVKYDSSKKTALNYKYEIQTQLNKVVNQKPTAYSFEFSTTADAQQIISLKFSPIIIKIKVGNSYSSLIKINVKRAASDQEQANYIADEINGESDVVNVKDNDTNFKAQNYKEEILEILYSNFHPYELGAEYDFVFSGTSGDAVITIQGVVLGIKIKVGSSLSKTVHIFISRTKTTKEIAQEQAKEIKDRIVHANISVIGNSTDLQTETAAIKNTLFLKNQTPGNKLTRADLQKITFTGGPLVANSSVNITATITVGNSPNQGIAIKNLKITLIKGNQQTADFIVSELDGLKDGFSIPSSASTKTINDYKPEIQTLLNKKVPQTTPNYSFVLNNPADGNKQIVGEKTIQIKIKFNNITSQTIANITLTVTIG